MMRMMKTRSRMMGPCTCSRPASVICVPISADCRGFQGAPKGDCHFYLFSRCLLIWVVNVNGKLSGSQPLWRVPLSRLLLLVRVLDVYSGAPHCCWGGGPHSISAPLWVPVGCGRRI